MRREQQHLQYELERELDRRLQEETEKMIIEWDEKIVEELADSVFREMYSRKGFDDLFDSVSKDIQDDFKSMLRYRIRNVLMGRNYDGSSKTNR